MSESNAKRLAETYGTQENSLWYWCFFFSHMIERGDPMAAADGLTSDKCKEMILHLLDEERSRLEAMKRAVDEKETLQHSARVARLTLPDGGAGERILRYETTIERQLYRALNQLERLQRQRMGEAVPPPLTIDVDRAG